MRTVYVAAVVKEAVPPTDLETFCVSAALRACRCCFCGETLPEGDTTPVSVQLLVDPDEAVSICGISHERCALSGVCEVPGLAAQKQAEEEEQGGNRPVEWVFYPTTDSAPAVIYEEITRWTFRENGAAEAVTPALATHLAAGFAPVGPEAVGKLAFSSLPLVSDWRAEIVRGPDASFAVYDQRGRYALLGKRPTQDMTRAIAGVEKTGEMVVLTGAGINVGLGGLHIAAGLAGAAHNGLLVGARVPARVLVGAEV